MEGTMESTRALRGRPPDGVEEDSNLLEGAVAGLFCFVSFSSVVSSSSDRGVSKINILFCY